MRHGTIAFAATVLLSLTGCSKVDVNPGQPPVGLPDPLVQRSWCPDLPPTYPDGLTPSARSFPDEPLPPPTVPKYRGDDREYATQLLCFFNAHTNGLSAEAKAGLPKLEPTDNEQVCPRKLHGAVPFEYCLELDKFFYLAGPGQMRKEFESLGQSFMFVAGMTSFTIYLSTKIGLHVRSGESVVCATMLLNEGLVEDGVLPAGYSPKTVRDADFDKAMNGTGCPKA